MQAEVGPSVKGFKGQVGNLQDSSQRQHGAGTGQSQGVGWRSAYLEIIIKSKGIFP